MYYRADLWIYRLHQRLRFTYTHDIVCLTLSIVSIAKLYGKGTQPYCGAGAFEIKKIVRAHVGFQKTKQKKHLFIFLTFKT